MKKVIYTYNMYITLANNAGKILCYTINSSYNSVIVCNRSEVTKKKARHTVESIEYVAVRMADIPKACVKYCSSCAPTHAQRQSITAWSTHLLLSTCWKPIQRNFSESTSRMAAACTLPKLTKIWVVRKFRNDFFSDMSFFVYRRFF